MSLPATITVNVGDPAGNVVYTKSHESPNEALYHAPSGDGTLTGRPLIRISRETTGKGVLRTLLQVKMVDRISLDGSPVSFATANETLVRRLDGTLVNQDLASETCNEAWAQLRSNLVNDSW